MWRVAALLVVASACGSKDVPERTNYAPLTAETSIAFEEVFVSDIEQSYRYITVLGDGTVRSATSRNGSDTHAGHASRGEVAHVLNALAAINFLELRCNGGNDGVDHGLHVSLTLVARGTTNRVELDDCTGTDRAGIQAVVKELEMVAERATAR